MDEIVFPKIPKLKPTKGVVEETVSGPSSSDIIAHAKKRVIGMSSGQQTAKGGVVPVEFPQVDIATTMSPKPPTVTPTEEPAGLWGKAVKGVAAAIKTPGRLLANVAQVAGYASMGDTAGMADVPTFVDTAVKAYHDSAPSLKVEMLRGLGKASQVAKQVLYHTPGVVIPAILGAYAPTLHGKGKSKTDLREAGRVANEALMQMDQPYQDEIGGWSILSELNKSYPQFGPGVTYITYQKGRKTLSAKVSNSNVRDMMQQITDGGGKIIDTQTVDPIEIAVLSPSLTFHPNDIIAFTAEMTDPLMAGIFGAATKVALKALPAVAKAVARVPGVSKAVDEISRQASKVVEPGTPLGKLINDLETSKWTGLTLTKTTKGYRAKLYPLTLGSRAVQSQMSQQSNAVTELLRGTNKKAANTAQKYIDCAEAAGGVNVCNASGEWLVNHGLVTDEGLLESARSIVRIHKQVQVLSVAERKHLEKLAYSDAIGDTTQTKLLARIEKDIADGIPVDPLSPEIKKSYTVLRTLAKKSQALGVDPGDIKVLANALTLPKGGLGILSDDAYEAMNDFARVLKGDVPEHLAPTPVEMTDLIGRSGPQIAALGDTAKRQLIVGFKIIDNADGLGVSSFAQDRMRKGLLASINTRYPGRTDLDNLVHQVMDAEDIIKATMAPGPKVKYNARVWASRVRTAVSKEALASGFDPDVVHRMAKMARGIDEQWGRLEVDLGVISETQFERMRGIHLRRMYDFDNIEAKLQNLALTDPVRAGELRTNFETYKAGFASLEKSGMKMGGIGTRIAAQRQNLTPEFREWLDEVNNISDAVLVSGQKAANDISTGMLYRALSKSTLASETQIPGWTPLLGKNWGDLNGKWVPKTIAGDLTRFATEAHTRPTQMLNWWTKHIITPFKLASVVYYPIARMHNEISNFVATQLATGITDVERVSKFGYASLSSLYTRDKFFQRYARYSPSVREASVLLHETFADLAQTSLSDVGQKSLLQRARNGLGRVTKPVKQSMMWEEAAAKMQIFHAAVTPVAKGGLGMADKEAVLLAEQWMIDYGNVPPLVDLMRRKIGTLPFITYSYKMVGNLGKAMAQHPEVLGKGFRNVDAFTELFDPGGIKRGKEKVGLPEWLQDKIIIRLPGKESRYINVDPYIPWSILNIEGNANAPWWTRALSQLGQPFKAIVELGTNVNIMNGAPIVPEGASPEIAAQLRTKYIINNAAVARQAMSFFTALKGMPTTPTAKPQQWWEVLADIRNLDINKGAELSYRHKQNQIVKAIGYARKVLNDASLSEEKRTERFESMMKYVDGLKQELLQIGDGMVQLAHVDKLLTDSGANPEQVKQLSQWFNEQNEPTIADKIAVNRQGLDLSAIAQKADEMIAQLQRIGTMPIKVGKPPVPPEMRPQQAPKMRQSQPALATADKKIQAAGAQPTEIVITRDILPGLPAGSK